MINTITIKNKNNIRIVFLVVTLLITKICISQDSINQEKYLDSKIQYSIKKRLLSSIHAVSLFDNAESDSSLIHWVFNYEKNNFFYTIIEFDTTGVLNYCIVNITSPDSSYNSPIIYYKRNNNDTVGRFFHTHEGSASPTLYFVDLGKSIAFDLSYYENNNFFEFINYIRTEYYPYIKIKKPFEYRKKRNRKKYFFKYKFKTINFEKLFEILFKKSESGSYYWGY